jgi:hypothetical protein
VLHQLSLEWRRSQAKDFPKSHFLGLLELQRNVVTAH